LQFTGTDGEIRRVVGGTRSLCPVLLESRESPGRRRIGDSGNVGESTHCRPARDWQASRRQQFRRARADAWPPRWTPRPRFLLLGKRLRLGAEIRSTVFLGPPYECRTRSEVAPQKSTRLPRHARVVITGTTDSELQGRIQLPADKAVQLRLTLNFERCDKDHSSQYETGWRASFAIEEFSSRPLGESTKPMEIRVGCLSQPREERKFPTLEALAWQSSRPLAEHQKLSMRRQRNRLSFTLH